MLLPYADRVRCSPVRAPRAIRPIVAIEPEPVSSCSLQTDTKSAADRLVVSQAESKPLVTELRVWFETQLAKLPARGPLAEAITAIIKIVIAPRVTNHRLR